MKYALALALLLLAAGVGVWLAAAPPPAPPPPAPPPPLPAPVQSGGKPPSVVVLGPSGGERWDPSRHTGPVHLRLERDGDPRRARVWLERELLGRLAVDAGGRHSGEAIGRLLSVARLLGGREVLIVPAADLAPELAAGLVQITQRGGAASVRVVDSSPQPGDGLSGDGPGR